MKKYHTPARRALAVSIASVFLATLFSVAAQFFKGNVLDQALAGDSRQSLHSALALLACIVLELALFHLYGRQGAAYEALSTRRLRDRLMRSILGRSFMSFRRRAQGDYLEKYSSEVGEMEALRFSSLPMIYEILIKIVLVSAALFWLDWKLALITLALLTTPLYVPKLAERRLKQAKQEHLAQWEHNMAQVSDWLSGFEVIKNFAAEPEVAQRFDRMNQHSADLSLRNKRLHVLAGTISACISYLSYFVVLAAAAWLVLQERFSAGQFFIAIGMIDQLSWPLIALSRLIRNLISARAVSDRLNRLITEGETADEGPPSSLSFEQSIRFEDVAFAYAPDAPLIRGFTMTLRKGERCLLQGASGSGKTTLTNLLLRYHDPSGGAITVDGISILTRSHLYDLATVVRQDAVLFRDTLRNNLTMYQPAEDDRLIALLKRFRLDRVASAQGLDMPVEENGANLSGGERKRICVLRALLRQTPLLILDEPLANLDTATAGEIEDMLLEIEDRTLMVISHQFSPDKLTGFDQVIHLG